MNLMAGLLMSQLFLLIWSLKVFVLMVQYVIVRDFYGMLSMAPLG